MSSIGALGEELTHFLVDLPVLAQGDHVVRPTGIVVERVLGQRGCGIGLVLTDVHGLGSCPNQESPSSASLMRDTSSLLDTYLRQ